jgi:RND family efflux transporter MFP subunit
MITRSSMLIFAIAASSMFVGGRDVVRAEPAPSASSIVIQGTTTPSDTRKLGFDIRGVVGQIHIKRGDIVQAGSKLLSLVDEEERAQLEYYQRRADVTLDIAEAEAQLELRRIDLARKSDLFDNKAVSKFELQTAETEVKVAEIKVQQARHAGDVNLSQAAAQESRVRRLNMMVPADVVGDVYVRDVIVKSGENVDESRPVIEIIDLDPLYVEVKLLESSRVDDLKVGQSLSVRYTNEDEWFDAKINFIDPQADARAGTRMFRMEMPNPKGREAGLQVDVRVP